MTDKKQRETQTRRFLQRDLPRVRRFAYALTGNKADADDLVQNLAIRLLRTGLPDAPDVLSWVFRVCKNLWIDELRARTARQKIGADWGNDEDYSDSQAPHMDLVLETARTIKAMDQLQEGQRLALSLVSVEGLSYAEAAQVMSVPVGTVMSRVARARENLMKVLNMNKQDVKDSGS